MADTKPKAKTTSGRLPFPQRVYNVLKLAEDNHQEHILSWVNNGTGFKVHSLEEFEKDLLPKYFNTYKYASFTRTLSAYGFDCVRTGRQTGIYSHPKFIRNDTSALAQIKRVKNNKTAKQVLSKTDGISDSTPPSSHQLPHRRFVIRDGSRMITFPSLFDGPINNEHDNSSAFSQLYQTVGSQTADTATRLLVRLPPGAKLVTPNDSETNSVDQLSSPSPNLQSPSASASKSRHTAIAAVSESINSSDEQNHEEQIAENYRTVLDANVAPMPLSPRAGITSDHECKSQKNSPTFDTMNDGLRGGDEHDDDFEPIAWSPQHSPLDDSTMVDHASGEVLSTSLEPRTIQEMKENPNSVWYNALPKFPDPRYQALYDYSSPIALPGMFYYMDISSFGMYWAIILIAGHSIQALFTDYGPNTRNLVWSPKISLLKHFFMDIMWVQSLLSAMILIPQYFGTSSVMLATVFLSSNPPSLGTSLKSHYHFSCQKIGPFVYGEWWMADIIRWLFLGYATSILSISLGHFFGIGDIKVVGVFAMNLTPLFACQSYRLLLSIATVGLEHDISDKKLN